MYVIRTTLNKIYLFFFGGGASFRFDGGRFFITFFSLGRSSVSDILHTRVALVEEGLPQLSSVSLNFLPKLAAKVAHIMNATVYYCICYGHSHEYKVLYINRGKKKWNWCS
jgi:hypothetical protein